MISAKRKFPMNPAAGAGYHGKVYPPMVLTPPPGVPIVGGMNQAAPPPYGIIEPQRRTLPFVYNIPHSGRYYPPDLLQQSCLSLDDLRAAEDCLVDHLYAGVPALGAPMLVNAYARVYLDTNRDALELDPKIVEPPLPAEANTGSERVAAGLGVIPAVTSGCRPIYRRPLTADTAARRIDAIHRPVHAALTKLMTATLREFGYAVLIDCHSMPGGSGNRPRRSEPDIVLGDRYGASCAPALVQTATAAFEKLGYTVARNAPYAGGFNTEHYGHPARGQHALQIEINRRLYLDERRFSLTPHAPTLIEHLHQVLHALHRIPAASLRPMRPLASGEDMPLRLSAE